MDRRNSQMVQDEDLPISQSLEGSSPQLAALKLSPLRLIGMVVLFAVFQSSATFLLGIFPSSDGELFYASASVQVAVLSYLICTLQGQHYKTHVWFFLALLIVSFGMAFPIAHDELPRRLPKEDTTSFLLLSLPWYWFCTLVAMSSVYLIQRVFLASILSGYRFLRGTLKFSVVNIFISTIMIFICLTLVSNVARLEYEYAMTIYVVSLLSIVLMTTTWIILMIHQLLATRPIAIVCLWSFLIGGSVYSAMQLIATHGKNLVDLTVYRTLVDGKFTDRDLDCVRLILLPLPVVVAIAVIWKPIRKNVVPAVDSEHQEVRRSNPA